jgi:hypothetical protein
MVTAPTLPKGSELAARDAEGGPNPSTPRQARAFHAHAGF